MKDFRHLSGDALSKAIAEMLVKLGKLRRETMQEGHYKELEDNGMFINPRGIWVTLMDGDELWGELHANYGTDERAAFTLTVAAGWTLTVYQWDGSNALAAWRAAYGKIYVDMPDGEMEIVFEAGSTPAEAICRARLRLHEREGV